MKNNLTWQVKQEHIDAYVTEKRFWIKMIQR
jgi:hypothetical protein